MSRLRKSVTAYSGLLVLSIIWGLAFVAIKQADTELSPVNLALPRWLVASVPFLVLPPIIGRPMARFEPERTSPGCWLWPWPTWQDTTSNFAETTLSAGLSALLTAFGPIFIVILSHLLLRFRRSPSTAG
jgi:drug/metabolite transporter (DMT)-like permease